MRYYNVIYINTSKIKFHVRKEFKLSKVNG